MIRSAVLALGLGLFAGCSNSQAPAPAAGALPAVKIIDRAPGVSAQPEWTANSKKGRMYQEGVQWRVMGFVTMDFDSRPDACTRAASVQARQNVAAYISQDISQRAGFSEDDKKIVVDGLAASFTKRQRLMSAAVADDYWQVSEREIDGAPARRMECWAVVTVERTALAEAVKRAAEEMAAKSAAAARLTKPLQDAYEKLEKDEQG